MNKMKFNFDAVVRFYVFQAERRYLKIVSIFSLPKNNWYSKGAAGSLSVKQMFWTVFFFCRFEVFWIEQSKIRSVKKSYIDGILTKIGCWCGLEDKVKGHLGN